MEEKRRAEEDQMPFIASDSHNKQSLAPESCWPWSDPSEKSFVCELVGAKPIEW